jgi:hypothetical protein
VPPEPVVFVAIASIIKFHATFTRTRDNHEANWHAGTRGLWECVRRLSPARPYVIVLTLLSCAGNGCENRGKL